MDEPKRGRGRPRREGADEEILAVAREMLHEKGYRELTVDAVAERAGVAKTTVYRRWPSKPELIAAAFRGVATPNAKDDVTAILREICAIRRELGDPELLGVVRELIAPRVELLRELAGNDLAVDMMLGPVLLRDDVDEELAAAIVKLVRA